MRGILFLLAFLCVTVADSTGQIVVSDRFGRNLQARALRLVDWEGYIANPAVEFTIDLPEAWLPATVEIAGSDQRLYFAERKLARSEPSTLGDTGPKLTLKLESGVQSDPVAVAIWPDRDTLDEAHSLWIGVHTASDGLKTLALPIIVEDQDRDRPIEFPVTLETSFDATGFYTNPTVLAETQRAADDWAYFLADNRVDEVIRGSSRSWVWNADGFLSGYWVTNPEAFRGFYLYAWGMRGLGLFSGGAATGQYQTVDGWPIDILASGYVAMELRGNRNVLGWAFYADERDWWRSDNHPRGLADFYSIVHHQIGHAMFFSTGHKRWDTMKASGGATAVDIIDYLGGPAIVDRFDHIYDGGNAEYVVDPASRRGVFGSEYASGNGVMEPRRWIITKTDLLMAREVGYELRDTTPFIGLDLADEVTLERRADRYGALLVTGGVPDYFAEVVAGALPAGLSLNSFTGEILGVPTGESTGPVTIRVTDQLGETVEKVVTVYLGSVLATESEELPKSLGLSNYPNPFAQSTTVTFDLPQPDRVIVEVYDLQGRRLETLLSASLPAGTHHAAWNAGSRAPGVYLLRLQGQRSIETRSLTVVR
jgi:Putative Ig domain